ncbi:MAG: hypothetical protein EPN85_07205, partial [Bacteroidetes bacterium]
MFFSPLLRRGAGGEACAQFSIQDSVFNLYIDFARSVKHELKTENGRKFSDGLKAALVLDTKGEFAFDSLQKYKVMILSPDKQVRIFTWDVEAEDGTHLFYGFIQAYVRKLKKFETYQLNDKSEGIKDPENAVLDNTKWFGAYYYQVVFVKHKKKKYYVLLGWDGNNRISNKRLIDVLYFTDKGFPKFGDAIFSSESGKTKKRMIFEYQAGLFMALRYDEERNAIVFDHLSPSNPGLEGQYSFYGPDFSYDMIQFKSGKWIYIKDVLPRNDKSKPDKHF